MAFTVVVILASIVGLGAIATVIGTRKIERAFPPKGRFVEVAGGRMHVVEFGSAHADEPTIVMVHGASGNLEDLRPLAESFSRRHVVLIDRPGHGWSDRPGGADDASPARQAALISETLTKLGAARVVMVGHSLAGVVATAFALAEPSRVAGLVLLAPVTHPWSGSITWYYTLTSLPVVGTLFAYTLALPLGVLLLPNVVTAVFSPEPPPVDYAERVGASLVLRPNEFMANARDVSGLLDFVKSQMLQYRELKMPVTIFSGDRDDVVSATVHARAFAAMVPQAQLTLLPGVGHMPHYATPELVVSAIEKLVARRQGPIRGDRPESNDLSSLSA